MGAKASYLIFCDPAPTGLGLQTAVETLRINDRPTDANDFVVAGKPHVFLNKAGFDIGPVTAEQVRVVADVTLEGNARRSFRLYVCIEGIPCVGVGQDPLQATTDGGHALLNGLVEFGEPGQDCADFLDAMLKREEDRLDPAAGLMAAAERAVVRSTAPKPARKLQPPAPAVPPTKKATKSQTAAIIKKILKP